MSDKPIDAASRCPLCRQLDRAFPPKRGKVDRRMIELWHDLWAAARLSSFSYTDWSGLRDAVRAEFPDDYHWSAHHCSDAPYFNLGSMESAAWRRELHLNGF